MLAGCATPAGGCADGVASGEEILLQATARAGRLVNSDRESVAWHGNGELLVTPTALYMSCAGGADAISYATITGITVRDVGDWVPFFKEKTLHDLLVIQTSRPTCWKGCVYELNDPALARHVVEMVEAYRPTVDPFGRRDGPRRIWLAAGLRNAMTYWAAEPAFLEEHAPGQRAAIEDWFCARMNCKGGGNTAGLYGPALRRRLPGQAETGYAFLELPGVKVNHRTELALGALVKSLKTADPDIHSLLVSGLHGIAMTEKVSPDYRISVEVTFRAFVDYFDLEPIKDGAYFFESHAVTRPLEEWLSLDQAAFDAEIEALAQRVAARIRHDLASHDGAATAVSCFTPITE
jgi:hypothetical protein